MTPVEHLNRTADRMDAIAADWERIRAESEAVAARTDAGVVRLAAKALVRLAEMEAAIWLHLSPEWTAPTDRHGLCLECKSWTPAHHPEAHAHRPDCAALGEEIRRGSAQGRALEEALTGTKETT